MRENSYLFGKASMSNFRSYMKTSSINFLKRMRRHAMAASSYSYPLPARRMLNQNCGNKRWRLYSNWTWIRHNRHCSICHNYESGLKATEVNKHA